MLSTLKDQVDSMLAALLVIDMQNDFVADDGMLEKRGFNVKNVQATVPKINRFIEEARKAGVMVIWIRTTHTLRDAMPNYLAHTIARKADTVLRDEDLICRPNHWGSEYYEKMIKPLPSEIEVIKNMYGAFQDTKLDVYLRVQNRETIICTGTSTNVCILSTALQGIHKGYYAILVTDCTSSHDPSVDEVILKNHEIFFGHIATSDEIINCWRGDEPRPYGP